MTFFKTFFASLTDLHAYMRFLADNTIRQGLKYVLKFYLILLVIGMIGAVIAGIYLSQTIQKIYPQDLVFSYTNGELKTQGASLPFILQVPQSDAKVALEAKQFTLSTSDQHITYTDIFPSTAFTIGKSDFTHYATPTFIGASIAMVCALWFVGILSRALTFATYTVLFYLFTKLSGKHVPYIFFFQLGLFVLVAAEFISLAATILYRGTTLPIFDIAFLGINALVLFTNRKPHQA